MTPNWFKIIKASSDSEPVVIQIYSQIGKDWWTNTGTDAESIAEELNAIPMGKEISLRINSPGGNVFEGHAVYNLLKARSKYITGYVDGVAASIASVILLAASKRVIPKNASVMIHEARCLCDGTVADMEKAIELLDSCNDAIVAVYVDETGMKESEVRQMMAAETWLVGQKAIDKGFGTQLTEEVQAAASFDLSRFRNAPKANRGDTAQNSSTDKDHMKPTTLLLDPSAGENAGGGGGAAPAVKPVTATTSPEIVALNGQLASVTAQLGAVTARLEIERKSGIEKTIDGLISEGRVLASAREFWVNAALKDESVIAQLRQHQAVQLPTDDIRPLVDVVKASIADIGKEMDRLRAPQASFLKGNGISVGERIASANAAANFHRKNRDRLMEVMNANTIGSGLKRQVLLQEIMRAFARQLMPLKAFSSVFSGIPLEGTNVVEIPYFPLVSTASTDWVAASGYVMGDSTQNTKNVTVNKRKYQPIRFTSDELARQPALNLLKIGEAKAEKLAADVFADVLSLVTVANYGATPTPGAASSFDLADILTLKGVADGNTVNWPKVGRSLVVQSAVDLNILTQSDVKSALNFGSADPVQNGSIKKIYGFEYYMCDFVPANGEQLLGFITYMSAILFAGSPIGPADEVRAQLSAYEVVTDPQTGASFEYRLWGNPDMDERRQVIECNYGYAVGESAALKRIAVV